MTQNNLELMRTLDDSWNAQDWETFEKRHSRDTAVFWPGQAEPTRGRDKHKAESIEFFKTFPDNHLINHPYKVEIAQGEWTCTVADFTGTMRGPMKGFDGKLIAPTNKKFHIEFCTVAHWKNGEIVEDGNDLTSERAPTGARSNSPSPTPGRPLVNPDWPG